MAIDASYLAVPPRVVCCEGDEDGVKGREREMGIVLLNNRLDKMEASGRVMEVCNAKRWILLIS